MKASNEFELANDEDGFLQDIASDRISEIYNAIEDGFSDKQIDFLEGRDSGHDPGSLRLLLHDTKELDNINYIHPNKDEMEKLKNMLALDIEKYRKSNEISFEEKTYPDSDITYRIDKEEYTVRTDFDTGIVCLDHIESDQQDKFEELRDRLSVAHENRDMTMAEGIQDKALAVSAENERRLKRLLAVKLQERQLNVTRTILKNELSEF